MPINDEARSRADSWDAQKWEMIEHECEPHPSDYAVRGPGSMRIYSDIRQLDQKVMAWHTQLLWMLPQRTIYMDGRPHPSEYAAHTWQGFSTGEWVADMLKVTTTHMKEGWIRRNGIPRSDKATMTEFYIRHGSYFTMATIVDDPIYLTEPFIRTSNWIASRVRRIQADELHTERRGAASARLRRPPFAGRRTRGWASILRTTEYLSKPRAAARKRCTRNTCRNWRKCPRLPSSSRARKISSGRKRGI